jgi:3-phosphoshikimate 1-carboxyvinyltransferase
VIGSIRPPGSKSLTNRALVVAALAEGTSTLTDVLDSDDTAVMMESLRRLGIDVAPQSSARRARVVGCAGRIPAATAELDVANSGTTMRFLAALVATGHGRYRLRGSARMSQRPFADMAAALRQLGATVQTHSPGECPPVTIVAHGLSGGRVVVRSDQSSQFASGLLMAAPFAASDVTIAVDGPLVSRPYVDMTLSVMRRFGAVVTGASDHHEWTVRTRHRYVATDYAVEPDASAASYFWAAAAITGGQVTVLGLGQDSVQGDVKFVELLAAMGCHVHHAPSAIAVRGPATQGIDADLGEMSDTVQTLAAVALFVTGATRIRGVAHIRHKETNRIGHLATELRRLGATVIEHDDGLEIRPSRAIAAATVQTYDDHRMAMALSLVGLRAPGIVIADPACVSKTYPDFFADMQRLRNAAP